MFDVHCWSYFCVCLGLNDSLGEKNELFSGINWIVVKTGTEATKENLILKFVR